MEKQLNVLFIEDNLIEIMKMKRTISYLKLNHTLSFANNGEEALEILADKTNYPDLILLDLNRFNFKLNEFKTN